MSLSERIGPIGVSFARTLDWFIFHCLIVIVALTAVPRADVHSPWTLVFECAVFTLGMLYAIQGLITGTLFVRTQRVIVPLLLIVGFALIQVIPGQPPLPRNAAGAKFPISYSTYETLGFVYEGLALIVSMALLLRYTTDPTRLKRLVWTLITIGVVSSVFGLMRQWSDSQNAVPAGEFGQFVNRNHFGFLAEMSLGLVLGLITAKGASLMRIVFGLLMAAVMWLAVISTSSRGAIMSIVAEVGFIAAFISIARPKQRRATELEEHNPIARFVTGPFQRLLAVVCLVLLMFGGVMFVGGKSVTTRFETLSRELSGKGRMEIWKATWPLIKSHPVVGVGFGGYRVAISRYYKQIDQFSPEQAHNDYLELLASGGIIGVGLGCLAIGFLVREALTNPVANDPFLRAVRLGSLAGIFAVAAHSSVDFGIHITVNAVILISLVVIFLKTSASACREIPRPI